MIWIRDLSTVPDNGWRYPGLNGHVISVRNYSLFYPAVVKHYTANGVTPPTEQDVVQYVCSNLCVPCFEGSQPLINRWTQGLGSGERSGCGAPCGSFAAA